MIVSPHFAQILWRRDIAPSLSKEKRAFTLSWLAALSVLLLLMCTPYENDFIAVTWYLFSFSSLPSVSVSFAIRF